MKKVQLVIALLVSLGSLAAFADTPGVGIMSGSTTTTAGATGAELYAHICQGCHMVQAQGATGAGKYPSLASNPALKSVDYVAVTVLLGKRGMPAFGKPADPSFNFGEVHISDADIAEVVNFVRSHFGNQYQDKIAASKIESMPHPIN
jgi:mono/diheme cytochrome c family protein